MPALLPSSTPLFDGLTAADVTAILTAARRRRYSRTEFVCRQGDPVDAVYMVATGQVRLTQLEADGQEVVIRFIGPGDIFGAVAAFKVAQFPVSGEAVEASEIMAWDRPTMTALVQRYPRLGQNLMSILSERIQEMRQRIGNLQTQRVERRIARTLLRLAQQAGQRTATGVLINLPLSRQDLAEMTGTTLYTVSRVLSQWEADGIVKPGRERVEILSPHALVTIAEDLPPS